MHLVAIDAHAVGSHVDVDRACDHLVRRRLPAPGSPRDSSDTGDQLAQPERLHDVVVRPEFEPDDAVDFLAPRRDDDDRHIGAGAQLATNGEAVHVREPEVEQDDVRLLGRERLRSGVRAHDGKAFSTQPLGQRLGDRRVVLDQQYPHGHIVARQAARRLGGLPILCQALGRGWPDPSPRARTVRRMKRTHTLLISVVLGIAVVLGSFAALRSSQLGSRGATSVPAAQIARQDQALDRAEAALRAELRRKPPALAATPAAAAPTVVYHRPPPIVRTVHRHGGEHETEGRDRGEAFDD